MEEAGFIIRSQLCARRHWGDDQQDECKLNGASGLGSA
jgi:hypothetical protein